MLIDPDMLREIRADPLLKKMWWIVREFDKYLSYTSTHVFNNRIMSYNWNTVDETDPSIDSLENIKEYENRWSVPWQNNVLRRLYNLKYYYIKYPEKMPKYSCMIVITGAHDSPDKRNSRSKNNLGHMAYLEKHYQARKLLLQYIRKYVPNVGRMVMSEGHPSSGFIHDNILLFLDEKPSEEVMEQIKKYWAVGLKMGSIDHALKYEFREVKDFKEIQSLVNYPMAYVKKNMWLTVKEWTKYDWVYNASVYWARKEKEHGGLGHVVRTFQPDKKLSDIMKCQYLPGVPDQPYKKGVFRYVDTRLHHLQGGPINEFYDELGNIHQEKIIDRKQLSVLVNFTKEKEWWYNECREVAFASAENYHDALTDWHIYCH